MKPEVGSTFTAQAAHSPAEGAPAIPQAGKPVLPIIPIIPVVARPILADALVKAAPTTTRERFSSSTGRTVTASNSNRRLHHPRPGAGCNGSTIGCCPSDLDASSVSRGALIDVYAA